MTSGMTGCNDGPFFVVAVVVVAVFCRVLLLYYLMCYKQHLQLQTSGAMAVVRDHRSVDMSAHLLIFRAQEGAVGK